jgi:hypothetical protein
MKYSRKIVDTNQSNPVTGEINSLTADANNPANSAADNAVIKPQL